ncbi:Mediator of RNA polymerase II transcription subunit 13-like [Amphibalanus amphitrite]|uniref:Mediator of RNA polymerase II transcription subunit 13 n=1 Tax=Amphibalanus amphitrite TaxID=1232801 RepID=A0A6A4VWE4_AMPAM|nr:Mediator of RNA polymerase II transcription subunit 13-like [Amphibalanus amphitrite]
MTNSNSHVNGASLEDCHTNFFALTDLCGIKWRSYRIEHELTPDPLEDPVISSFTKCLASDILSVWRRVQHAKAPPAPPPPPSMEPGAPPPPPPPPAAPPTVTTYKELWIFWYGDEPELSNIIVPQLVSRKQDEGTWESGLSYECRSLLFKALHKFIERCLLSRGFVKLGKWFAQPCSGVDKSPNKANSANLCFAFSFFVHGESTVCASLSLRQHGPLRRLTRAHLSAAHGHGAGLPVVLAPYGLAGVLTGHTFRLGTPDTQKLVKAWRQFYPIEGRVVASLQTGREPHMPVVVEVLVGDVKMRYLTSYVLVSDEPSAGGGAGAGSGGSALRPLGVSTHLSPGGAATPPVSPSSGGGRRRRRGVLAVRRLQPAAAGDCRRRRLGAARLSRWPCAPGARPPSRAARAAARSRWGSAAAGDNSPESLGQWEFQDPIQKPSCACANCKRKVRQKQQYLKRQEKERPPRMKAGVCHRRQTLSEELSRTIDTDLVSGVARLNGAPPPPPPQAYYKSQVATPGSARPALTDGLPSVGPMDSPASVGPSPLPTPHSQPGPLAADHAMPTLSPHPPTPSGATPNPVTPLAGGDAAGDTKPPADPGSVATPVYSPYPKPASCGAQSAAGRRLRPGAGGGCCGAGGGCGGHQQPGAAVAAAPAAAAHHPAGDGRRHGGFVQPVQLRRRRPLAELSVKRPSELRTTFLRRIKDEVDRSERLLHDGDGTAPPAGRPPAGLDGLPLSRGTKRPADPYEFDDDPNAPVHMDGLKSEADESAAAAGGGAP